MSLLWDLTAARDEAKLWETPRGYRWLSGRRFRTLTARTWNDVGLTRNDVGLTCNDVGLTQIDVGLTWHMNHNPEWVAASASGAWGCFYDVMSFPTTLVVTFCGGWVAFDISTGVAINQTKSASSAKSETSRRHLVPVITVPPGSILFVTIHYSRKTVSTGSKMRPRWSNRAGFKMEANTSARMKVN